MSTRKYQELAARDEEAAALLQEMEIAAVVSALHWQSVPYQRGGRSVAMCGTVAIGEVIDRVSGHTIRALAHLGELQHQQCPRHDCHSSRSQGRGRDTIQQVPSTRAAETRLMTDEEIDQTYAAKDVFLEKVRAAYHEMTLSISQSQMDYIKPLTQDSLSLYSPWFSDYQEKT